ncbi:CU044_5270 family protein [Streptosporangium sp. NPDC050855]|uniref:CU044_5270 family protein n=1 Tax=Streptosporangium sp. NPDC050855 TaxID=3366194 RepID=UPI00378F36DE
MDEMTQVNRLRSEVPLPGPAELRAEESRLLAEIAASVATVAPSARTATRAPARTARDASAAARGASAPGAGRASGSPAERPGTTRRLGERPEGSRRPGGLRAALPGNLRRSLAVGTGAAVVALAGTVYVTAVHSPSAGPDRVAPSVRMAPVAVTEVLRRAAETVSAEGDLRPRPGQFLFLESQVMFPVEVEEDGRTRRYLDRGVHRIWLPAEGSPLDGGVMSVRHLPPEPYPGEPLPAEALRRAESRSEPARVTGRDDRPDHLRTDYAYLSRLPADPAGMREHLFTGLTGGAVDHYEAWGRAGAMITQAYMPVAQRAALFRAIGTIPGVRTVEGVEDATGRRGVAAAMSNPESGIRHEYIFDPVTYRYLGERVVVVDAATAGAPAGSVLTSTALLKVAVADRAPETAPETAPGTASEGVPEVSHGVSEDAPAMRP